MADETIRGEYSWWRPPGRKGGGEEQVETPDEYDIYARLSYNLDGQKESCERQVGDCRELARRLGLTIGETWVDDHISAWQDGVRRPDWEACLKRIEERRIRGVVVWHGDRFIRKPKDLIRLLEAAEAGAVIHSYGSGQRDLTNPEHRRILWYEVIHADASSEDTSRRVKAGLAAAAAKGRPAVGRRGYGYGVPTGLADADGKEVIDKRRIVESEAAVVREATDRVLAGESMRSVVNDFAARAVPTLRGGQWEVRTLRDVLSSPRIAGLRVHQGKIVGKADWPAIIPEGRWRQLQAALAGRSTPPQRHPGREYLASGLAACGRCGAKLATKAPWSGERSGKRRRKVDGEWKVEVRHFHTSYPAGYMCRRDAPHGGCGRMWVQAAPLDAHLSARLRALAADPAALAGRDVGAEVEDAAAELERVRANLKRLAQQRIHAAGPGRMDMDEYMELRSPLVARRDELEARVAGRDRPSPAAVAGGLLWDQMTYTQRRAFARALVDVVVVSPAVRRGGPFDPSRVEIRWR